ncbi:hypothetical protein [Paraburkholderia sp. BCC1884]|uniref:phage tail assembly protein T n=1 Tax=Paraburkholderia sp. BCC1884 TaxID=2562668 RepID=UPI0011833FF0|nr:hypothetical protein [Paraburkholderia sp. BCC1884]
MSVRRCQNEIDSAEFVEWMAFSGIDGLTAEMDDLRCGLITAATYNVHRDTKKARKPFGPADVVPWLKTAELEVVAEPILLGDAKAQSKMIRAALFGRSTDG